MSTSPASATSVPHPTRIDQQQQHDGSVFPFAFTAAGTAIDFQDVLTWVAAQRDELLRLSTTHGAVLFRDFPMRTVEQFDAFTAALKLTNFPYKKSLSNAVRVNRTERIFSANEAPPEVSIFFHHEMAQTPIFPERILFFCEIAAQEGGATPICRSDVLLQRLDRERPIFVDHCRRLGLRYTSIMPGDDDPKSGMGRSWRSTLGVEDRDAAEARLSELDYSWDWTSDGCLKATTPPLPAVMRLADGRETFFNQLIAAYRGWKDARNDPSQAIRHGDGSLLDAEAVRVAIELSDELAFDLAWQAGDGVLIDNTVVMHARGPFKGPRKVVASLAAPRTQSFVVHA